MIKASAEHHVILGITDMNVKKLKEGLLIKIDGKEMGIEKDIIILHGKNEMTLAKDFEKHFDLSFAKVKKN
jgi:lactam utilization protein B